MNIKFQAYRLQRAHAELEEAREADDEMVVEIAEREIAMRRNLLKEAGFQVFDDKHDVMLVAA